MSTSFYRVLTSHGNMGARFIHDAFIMLVQHDTDLWSIQHTFKLRGMAISSRMTVVRLADGRLWLHSPVPVSVALRDELATLGDICWLVAPSRAHDLFLSQAHDMFASAEVWVAPGMIGVSTVPLGARTLDAVSLAGWAPALEGLLIAGMPRVNETIWFHRPSGTLIVTDLLQWWRGPLPWNARLWACLMGVRREMGASRFFMRFVEDRVAFRRSLAAMYDWPVRSVLLCHNSEVHLETPEQLRAHVGLGRVGR